LIYPDLLKQNDLIGICAPSSGVPEELWNRLDLAITNVEKLGYRTTETDSVRKNSKCVSADAPTRAKEFMELFTREDVKVILPPWGGEFLMDMLPCLDSELIRKSKPKWVVGYSDTATLTFVLTVLCDIATVHGSNLMNMSFQEVYKCDRRMFEIISNKESYQINSEKFGGFTQTFDDYVLDQVTEFKLLKEQRKEQTTAFGGRVIGGCLDTLCKLLGTTYAPVNDFLEKYKDDGFIWTLESCEMSAGDIYRTLWQMKECGWFRYCNGCVFGRVDGYTDTKDFTFVDAYEEVFDSIPVIYDADIGHVPPQMQLVNGAYASVEFDGGKFSILQKMI
jgi:muramoyltetrapeptide carboxypeptidase LdcA involved in peptidoglycan recycling